MSFLLNFLALLKVSETHLCVCVCVLCVCVCVCDSFTCMRMYNVHRHTCKAIMHTRVCYMRVHVHVCACGACFHGMPLVHVIDVENCSIIQGWSGSPSVLPF